MAFSINFCLDSSQTVNVTRYVRNVALNETLSRIFKHCVQGELLPVKARSLGIGCLGFIVSLISFGLVKSIPNMFATIGIHGTFLMCACFAIFTMIFSFFFMPETFGLTLEEIEDLYRQENPISGEKKH